MKTLIAILIAVLVIHMQCRVSCLAHTTSTTDEPPCHKHPEAPANSVPPTHETNSSCSQGLVSALQVTMAGKHLVLPLAAVLPVVVRVPSARDNVVPIFGTINAPLVSSPPAPVSVLRI